MTGIFYNNTQINPDGTTYEGDAKKVSGYYSPYTAGLGAQVADPFQYIQGSPNFQSRIVAKTAQGEIVQWRIKVDDLSGGEGPIAGDYTKLYNKVVGGTSIRTAAIPPALVTRFYNSATLPPEGVADVPADAGTGKAGVHSANALGRLWVGCGSTADKALAVETSGTNPAMSLITYTPTTGITCLVEGTVGGATATARLLVGRQGTSENVQIISDTSGTVAATMHNDTARCWGIIQSFVTGTSYSEPLMIYSSGAIRWLSKTAAATDAPTPVLSNVPNGGYALGIVRLAGGPAMAAWVWPREDTTSGMLSSTTTSSSSFYGRVVLTDLETGTNVQEVDFGMPVRSAAIVNNGSAIIVTNSGNNTVDVRVGYYDGRSAPYDLRPNFGWLSNSSVVQILGFFPNGYEIWAHCSIGSIKDANFFQIYDLRTNTWHYGGPAAGLPSLASTYAGTMPFSKFTRYVHSGGIHAATAYAGKYTYVPLPGIDYYNQQDVLGQFNTEVTASTLLPAWTLPGLEGWPLTINKIIFLGDVDAGGSAYLNSLEGDPSLGAYLGATVSITIWQPNRINNATDLAGNGVNAVAPTVVTFPMGQRDRAQIVEINNNELYYQVQLSITCRRTNTEGDGTQTAGIYKNFTPNALPFIVEGFAFVGYSEVPYFEIDNAY